MKERLSDSVVNTTMREIVSKMERLSDSVVNTIMREIGSKMKEPTNDQTLIEENVNYDLGLLFKILEKMLFCMKARTKLAVYHCICCLTEIVGLISDFSMIWLLFNTGFPYQALQLFLSKAN